MFQQHSYNKSEKVLLQSNIVEETIDEPFENFGIDKAQVIKRIFSGYDGEQDLSKVQYHVEESFRTGAIACLICIENVSRNDFIWSCCECFCSFHLGCIQKWAKDSIYLQEQAAQENPQLPIYQTNVNGKTQKKEFNWFCPKCRYEYSNKIIPSEYRCFCGKVYEPKFDPWILPHSCGEQCDKKIKPECGHSCLILCHPGPCPPCPITVRHPCYCPKKISKPRRCSSKAWSCDNVCQRILLCGHHKCEYKCHDGDCMTCEQTSVQKCQCGSKEEIKLCSESIWQCDKVCDKLLPCGVHKCEKICHTPETCGSCPRAGEKSCPCGKKTYVDLDCTQVAYACGDTCSKLLTCGVHNCHERCHTGPCPTCLQIRVKWCACGWRQKELPCSKNFTCDVKCKKLRDCRKHMCNRRCCTGNCPSCDQACGKTLTCGMHKCESRCHQMRCYPCTLTYKIACTCGLTSITVPCGRQKRTPKPKCNALCKKSTSCHHPKATPHNCHEGDCPPCDMLCGMKLTCGHSCPKSCHDAVRVKVASNRKPAGPWEKVQDRLEIRKLPCPPCMHPVSQTCFGGHETREFSCSEGKPFACSNECGRRLECSHHTCSKMCHTVEDSNNSEDWGSNCKPCKKACGLPRLPGCRHICKIGCHKGACAECVENVRVRCHCGIIQVNFRCSDWTKADTAEKESKMSCTNQCNKQVKCGHRCSKECHSGKCSSESECTAKMMMRCPCKRRKKEFLCKFVISGTAKLECDQTCKVEIKEKTKAAQIAEEQRKIKEEEMNKKELEEYERYVLGKKKRKEKKQKKIIQDFVPWWRKPVFLAIIFSIASAILVHLIFVR